MFFTKLLTMFQKINIKCSITIALLLYLFPIISFSQDLTMTIKMINVSYANSEKYMLVSNPDSGIYLFHEDADQGPFLGFVCIFKNETNKDIYLNPHKSTTYLCFNFQGKIYSQELFNSLYLEDNLIISPYQEVQIEYPQQPYLSYMGITKRQKYNYLLELCELLPTIQLKYIEDEFNVISTKIVTVNIHEFD